MKTIILYGELAKRFGKVHCLAVKNVAEAIRALKANYRGFETYMCGAHLEGTGFRVFVGGHGMADPKEMHSPSGENEVIRIVPVLLGAGSGAFKVILGVVLVAAAVAIGVLSGGSLSWLSQPLGTFGVAMIIGGVAQMLTKPPKTPGISVDPDQKSSYIFNGPVNTAVQGKAVPLGYGRMIVGSAVISAGIDTHETA
jgi:predicted phage tail protein